MNKQGRVELVVFLLPSRCLAVEAPEHGVLEEAFMDDLLASGVPPSCAGGAAAAVSPRVRGWWLSLAGLVGVTMLSHHLVSATRRRDGYKSNPFCGGGLEETNGCFLAQERKCQRCSPDRLAVSWGVLCCLS